MQERTAISFSPNLQAFLKKNPHYNQVHLDPTERVWYIGYMENIGHGKTGIWCGAKFVNVLCHGKKAETFSYPTEIVKKFVNRSEQFWRCSEYFGRRMFNKWYW